MATSQRRGYIWRSNGMICQDSTYIYSLCPPCILPATYCLLAQRIVVWHCPCQHKVVITRYRIAGNSQSLRYEWPATGLEQLGNVWEAVSFMGNIWMDRCWLPIALIIELITTDTFITRVISRIGGNGHPAF
jgi:hypothetical protein